MENPSLANKIICFLKQNPDERFTANEIAAALFKDYPEWARQKREKSQQYFASDHAFINQVIREIGARKNHLIKLDKSIKIQSKPRPRVYWYEERKVDEKFSVSCLMEEEHRKEFLSSNYKASYSEADLYPLLMAYLHQEYRLCCDRIDEKRSKNNMGKNANYWLHPDIVAMEPLIEEWEEHVKVCVKESEDRTVHLWSFEVKKQISRSNLREYFFQAVSNSSWANYGYLVCTGIEENSGRDDCMRELRMLSTLHGIGVMILNVDNPTESEIIIPALFKQKVDWESVNRIVKENQDMNEFIMNVNAYYQTGNLIKKSWRLTKES